MKRATSTPAGLNVKKITAYLKGQAKSRNAVRITCQSGSVYIITGYAAFKLPAILYRDVIQPVTMQDAPADRRADVPEVQRLQRRSQTHFDLAGSRSKGQSLGHVPNVPQRIPAHHDKFGV